MKIALGIEYNGKQYCGWQRQEKVRSVQEELEKALSFVANEKLKCFVRAEQTLVFMAQDKWCILKLQRFVLKKLGHLGLMQICLMTFR